MLTINKTLPKSIDNLVQLISKTLDRGEELNPKNIKKLVEQADIQEKDLLPFADFDHPIADCYGRKMVYESSNFEVMVMSWNPNDYSSIHNHGYTEWGVVQVFGNVHHMTYCIKDNELQFSKKEILNYGSIIKVNNALIHQMGNPSSERYLTLHVYGSNSITGDITADARNFDLEFDRIALTTGGAFFNLRPEAINSEEKGIQATNEVFCHYAKLLMDYYNDQVPSTEIRRLKENLLLKMKAQFI